MPFRRPSPSAPRSPWRILLALLCVALLLTTATVELTHHHADGEHAGCALCVVAHAVIHTVAAPALLVLFVRFAAVAIAARVLYLRKVAVFALFTRPPPACLAA